MQCSTFSPSLFSASGCCLLMTLCQGKEHFFIYQGLTNDFFTALPMSKASGLMDSSRMVPSELAMMMRVLRFDDY